MTGYLLGTPGLLSSYGLTRGPSGPWLGAHWDSALQGLLGGALAPLPSPPLFLVDSKTLPFCEAGWSSAWLESARRFPAGRQQVKCAERTSLSGHWTLFYYSLDKEE